LVRYDAAVRSKKIVNFVQKLGQVGEYRGYTHLPLTGIGPFSVGVAL